MFVPSVASAIFEAYLSGGARDFFAGHYADARDRQAALARAARPLAPPVASALAAQNARFAASPARDAHLAALRDGAVAVVTGQQVGLFLGPLFTLYKAASAVGVARALAAESGSPVVPIFWLQSEDHDLPEIDCCRVVRARAEPLELRTGDPSLAERIAIAHRVLPDGVAACVERLGAAIANLPHGAEHMARIARHYRSGERWVDAFAGLLAELFADDGLVLLDPRDPALAQLAAPVHHRALTRAGAIAASLGEQVRRLERAGYGATVHVRPGAPLSFFHPQTCAGPRYRLAPAAGGYGEVGGDRVHGEDRLLDVLAADPLRFSTSALLRPILQDALLPVAAYVAGPAEVAYFAQLAPLYADFDLPMPLVVPRARLRIIEERTARLLERRGLRADDVERPIDEILAMASSDAPALSRTDVARELLEPFAEALGKLRQRAKGPDVGPAFEKTRATVEGAVQKLADKLERAERGKDASLADDVRLLKTLLHPGGVPQERCYGISYFAARYGERALIESVLEAIDPFDPQRRDLSLPTRVPLPAGEERE